MLKRGCVHMSVLPRRTLSTWFRDEDLEEKFIRSGGPGGQSVNKNATCVFLRHTPSGISVKCQEQRSLAQNRKIAREWLEEKLKEQVHGIPSKITKKIEKKRRNKQRRKSRRNLKLHKEHVAFFEENRHVLVGLVLLLHCSHLLGTETT